MRSVHVNDHSEPCRCDDVGSGVSKELGAHDLAAADVSHSASPAIAAPAAAPPLPLGGSSEEAIGQMGASQGKAYAAEENLVDAADVDCFARS